MITEPWTFLLSVPGLQVIQLAPSAEHCANTCSQVWIPLVTIYTKNRNTFVCFCKCCWCHWFHSMSGLSLMQALLLVHVVNKIRQIFKCNWECNLDNLGKEVVKLLQLWMFVDPPPPHYPTFVIKMKNKKWKHSNLLSQCLNLCQCECKLFTSHVPSGSSCLVGKRAYLTLKDMHCIACILPLNHNTVLFRKRVLFMFRAGLYL